MKIYYIHQYFRTPEQGGAVRSYHLAKGLVKSGIEVEIITAHSLPDYDQRWIDGIKVHYLPVPYEQKFGFLKRIWAFWNFVFLGRKLLKKLPRPDLLYITSTPLSTGLLGLWVKKKKAIPYIFEVRDLWPEAPIQVGAIKNFLLIKWLRALERKIYSGAMSLVALSPGIAVHLKKITPEKEVALIPNFSDLDRFYPMEKPGELEKKLPLKSGLTIAYTGAIGLVNAVDELLKLAKMAKEKGKNWNFLIMGEGSHLDLLNEKTKLLDLGQVHFIPFGPKEKVNEILNLADFAWISFAHFPVLKTNSPNKFFDALAAGKAILVNHKGWVHDLVKSHQLGIPFLPGKWEKAFQKLEELESNPSEIKKMGQKSRKLAETYFSKEIAVDRLVELIQPKPKPIQSGGVDIRTA
ncbi:glycosyltransferase involved in cell wall biosynthesis [Algoriphagus boseongensis]|uniref:Glycosyltransferase involved in cell wall biosynthesis n=1 Tax=Algoriphagus boseongensis TaxID=1442587 RepID=A0A4R6T5Z9_9BACT|nr:glycosyltransferase family 4 protein [Algoriphagus boseongensis]TDQ16966.1 glycosyltransferase involved in cell wall biosynthesis [Algoriphagus boseongensis]